MMDMNNAQVDYASLLKMHALLQKKFELLEQREAVLGADTDMPSVERLKALTALAKGYARVADLMADLTEAAKTLKAQLCGEESDEDPEEWEDEDDLADDCEEEDAVKAGAENQDEDENEDETLLLDVILEKLQKGISDAENDLARLQSLPASERTSEAYREAYAAASKQRSDCTRCLRFIEEKKRQKEIEIIDSILEKFSEELADAKKDLAYLEQLPAKERLSDGYQKAYAAVTERMSDIELSARLLRARREALEKGEDV